jgi:hypothetical protein
MSFSRAGAERTKSEPSKVRPRAGVEEFYERRRVKYP